MTATVSGHGPEVDEAARWGLLATVLGGRALRVEDAGGAPPSTDGRVVRLDVAAGRDQLLTALAVQASLVGAGSLEPAVLRRLLRRPGLARRYLAVEGHRALAANLDLLPRAARGLLDPAVADLADSAAASLAVAAGRRRLPEPPAVFGVLRPREALRNAAPEDGDAAAGAGPRHRPRSAEAQLKELDDDAAAGEDVVDLYSSPIGGGGGIGKWLQKLLGATRQLGEGGSPGADSPTHRLKAGARPNGHGATSSADPGGVDDAGAAGTGAVYPEWDRRRGAYRPAWCTVQETEPDPGEDLPPEPWGNALRTPLARLATGLVRHHRQLQGDEIDVDAVVEARVALAARTAPSEALYVTGLRRRRDLSVLVLLDVSGSAGEPGPDGRTVHEVQRAAAVGITRALHDLGDRVALYGFNSQGRGAVNLMPVKRFDDGLDSRVLRRLAGLKPSAYSRLGAAIRHGATVLADQGGTSRRVLLVLSDGLAYDHGYERVHGAADVRRALAEARQGGTGCLCLTVGAGTDADDLRRVFGSAAHATVPRLDRLPAVLGPMFRLAIRSGEVRRRVS